MNQIRKCLALVGFTLVLTGWSAESAAWNKGAPHAEPESRESKSEPDSGASPANRERLIVDLPEGWGLGSQDKNEFTEIFEFVPSRNFAHRVEKGPDCLTNVTVAAKPRRDHT